MPGVTPLFDSAQISGRIDQLAGQIAASVSGELLVIGMLKGSFVFLADLVRALGKAGLAPQVDFIRASSYGGSKTSSGNVKLSCEPAIDIRGRQVLLVDDIVDSGRSLLRTRELLRERGAEKVLTCALLDKPGRRAVACAADFVGFSIEDAFVVGYGIDYAENYRHLPFIGVVE